MTVASSSDGGSISGWQWHYRQVDDIAGLEAKGSDSGIIVRWQRHRRDGGNIIVRPTTSQRWSKKKVIVARSNERLGRGWVEVSKRLCFDVKCIQTSPFSRGGKKILLNCSVGPKPDVSIGSPVRPPVPTVQRLADSKMRTGPKWWLIDDLIFKTMVIGNSKKGLKIQGYCSLNRKTIGKSKKG